MTHEFDETDMSSSRQEEDRLKASLASILGEDVVTEQILARAQAILQSLAEGQQVTYRRVRVVMQGISLDGGKAGRIARLLNHESMRTVSSDDSLNQQGEGEVIFITPHAEKSTLPEIEERTVRLFIDKLLKFGPIEKAIEVCESAQYCPTDLFVRYGDWHQSYGENKTWKQFCEAYEGVGGVDKPIEVCESAQYCPMELFVQGQKRHESCKAYEYVGRKDKLIELGDYCLQPGVLDFKTAEMAFAKGDAPSDCWLRLAEIALDRWYIDIAVRAYAKAGKTMPTEQVINKANSLLNRSAFVVELDPFLLAQKCYQAVDRQIPIPLIIRFAKTLQRCHQLVAIYNQANDATKEVLKDVLMEYADRHLNEPGSYCSYDDSLELYTLIEAPSEKKKRVADRYLETGYFENAMDLAATLDYPIPREKFEQIGDNLLNRTEKINNEGMRIFYAIQAYTSAGSIEKIVRIGNEAMTMDPRNLHLALVAYKAADNKEKLRNLSEMALKNAKESIERFCKMWPLPSSLDYPDNSLNIALDASIAIVDKNMLIEIGDIYLSDEYYKRVMTDTGLDRNMYRERYQKRIKLPAIQAYLAAGERNRVIEMVRKNIRKYNSEELREAMEIYKMAEAREAMIEVAHIFLDDGGVLECQKIYDELKVEMSKEVCIQCGDVYLSRGDTEKAREMYRKSLM